MKEANCYQTCNQAYTAMQPERLFCKKGCDSDENMEVCKASTCNKLCIKEEQGDQKLFFHFLYRAPSDPSQCLSACIFGCNRKDGQ